jgi:excisionase family DNA binding protein
VQPFRAPLQVHDGGSAELLGVRDVARRLGVSTATVYRWAEEGTLPHVRLSSNILRFRPQDVAEFIASRFRG